MKKMSVTIGLLVVLGMILPSFADITSGLEFYATFEGGDLNADINTHADWAKTPLESAGVSNNPNGKFGKGMYVQDDGAYGAKWRVGTFYSSGTVCFWFKPDGWELKSGTRRSLQAIGYNNKNNNEYGIITSSGQYDDLESRRYKDWSGTSIGWHDEAGGLGSDWIHIAVVWSDSQVAKLYINGNTVDVQGNNQILPMDTEHLTIGNSEGSGGSGFGSESGGGWYDEVRLYSRPLSAADIAEVYNYVPEPATIGLLAIGALGFIRRR